MCGGQWGGGGGSGRVGRLRRLVKSKCITSLNFSITTALVLSSPLPPPRLSGPGVISTRGGSWSCWGSIREAKKKQQNIWMDLVQLTWKPPPPPPPLKMDYVFCSPLFYRSFPIFRHNFYIKSKKKNVKSGLGPRPLRPLWTKKGNQRGKTMAEYDFTVQRYGQAFGSGGLK